MPPTRSGWAAAQRRWAADPVARTADLTDVGRGYRILDPLSSATAAGWVAAALAAAGGWCAWGARDSLAAAAAASVRAELAATAAVAAALAAVLLHVALRRRPGVYLLDFTTFKPPRALQVSHDRFAEITTAIATFSAEDIAFQTRLLGRSGIGDTSALPAGIHRVAELGEAAAAASALGVSRGVHGRGGRGGHRGGEGAASRPATSGGGGAGDGLAPVRGDGGGADGACGAGRRRGAAGDFRHGGPPSAVGGSDTGSSGGGSSRGVCSSGSSAEAGRRSSSSVGSTGSVPPPVNPSRELSLHLARQEAEQVIFGVVDELLARTRLDPRSSIDIVIVNCSLFSPSPSLSAMIVNHYRLRSSVRTYNLGGMGCSAGVIAVELARDLLQVYRGARALVVSTENLTQNWYLGAERSMLVGNALFRMGGSAVLMTSVSADVPRCRYRLAHVVRTHVGADDQAYDSIFEMEDVQGARGVKLSKNIMDVAGGALKRNLTELAPLVLPLREQARFFAHLARHLWSQRGWGWAGWRAWVVGGAAAALVDVLRRPVRVACTAPPPVPVARRRRRRRRRRRPRRPTCPTFTPPLSIFASTLAAAPSLTCWKRRWTCPPWTWRRLATRCGCMAIRAARRCGTRWSSSRPRGACTRVTGRGSWRLAAASSATVQCGWLFATCRHRLSSFGRNEATVG